MVEDPNPVNPVNPVILSNWLSAVRLPTWILDIGRWILDIQPITFSTTEYPENTEKQPKQPF
jgi:hypothetical protein